ncbi:TSUP family transporter [Azospirillum thermophilum]|uniref:TSUP family transporter n=1 Tax=Azospirillum thermophilum TaxID=2202148 RepID=UPI001FE8CFF7|nr:TSUP family transporter [Azospirillum thermophilum]
MDILTPETLGTLFAVGLLAGFIDSIAGGGGLLSIPALLAAGLPPAETLATNKLQASFGSFSATLKFVRQGEVRPGSMLPMIVCTFIGAAAGAIIVQILDSSFLRDVIPLLLIGIAIYLLVSPKAGDLDARQRIGENAFALAIGTGIGFYDGFFGPGTGTFFAIAFVSLLGYNLRKATAHTKVLNFTSNIASLLFFLAGGHVLWTVGLLMGWDSISAPRPAPTWSSATAPASCVRCWSSPRSPSPPSWYGATSTTSCGKPSSQRSTGSVEPVPDGRNRHDNLTEITQP